MTCIVGLQDEDRIYIGADSYVSSEDVTSTRKDAKVFRNGPALIGYASSIRAGQVLQYHFHCPTWNTRGSLHRWVVAKFVEDVRDCLDAFACVGECELLLGIYGELFEVGTDFQVGSLADNYAALGVGESYALGSLFSTVGLPPTSRVKLALGAASCYSPFVGGPLIVRSIKR